MNFVVIIVNLVASHALPQLPKQIICSILPLLQVLPLTENIKWILAQKLDSRESAGNVHITYVLDLVLLKIYI